jgi:hypothetical protein
MTVDTIVCLCNSELLSVAMHSVKGSNKFDHQSKTHLVTLIYVTVIKYDLQARLCAI